MNTKKLAQALEDIQGLSAIDGTTADKAASLLREHQAEIERLRAFRDFFTERCEMLFFHYGMEPVELFNKCALTPNV